jgi:hypothetical protein
MGYHHRARAVTCSKCSQRLAWFREGATTLPERWKCQCGTIHDLEPPPKWPEVPRALYIGPNKIARFKVYPFPPEYSQEDWAQPFSIRSFIYQASQKFGGCYYRPGRRGTVMDEPVFTDNCYDSLHEADYEEYATPHDCHLVGGWTTGQDTCQLWEKIMGLCQTEPERLFLKRYLQYVKDRQFPMLIPQTWIGITERRRPDFVAFVPLQFWKYKWVAIQLDAAHSEDQAGSDAARDDYVREHKYEVISLRPQQKGYFEEIRRLVEEFELWMSLADTDPWSVVVDAVINKVDAIDDSPF